MEIEKGITSTALETYYRLLFYLILSNSRKTSSGFVVNVNSPLSSEKHHALVPSISVIVHCGAILPSYTAWLP